jgi:anti-sigma factor RsiW
MTAPIVCANGVDLLMDYLEGVLPAARRSALDEHVAGCPRCVAFVRSYRETPRIFRAATSAAMPSDVQRSLRRFLAARLR